MINCEKKIMTMKIIVSFSPKVNIGVAGLLHQCHDLS